MLQVPYLFRAGMGYLFVVKRESMSSAGMREYVLLAIPGFLQSVLEWWVLELVILLVGGLGDCDSCLAASGVFGNIQAVMIMGWIGLLVAASVSIGRYVGAGNPSTARRAALAVSAVALASGGVAAIFIGIFRHQIARLYTRDSELVDLTASLLVVLTVVVILVSISGTSPHGVLDTTEMTASRPSQDAINNTAGGVMGGLALYKEAARAQVNGPTNCYTFQLVLTVFSMISQMVGFYVVGMPIAIFMAYGTWGVSAGGYGRRGMFFLWSGVGLGQVSSTALQLGVLLCRSDVWGDAARSANRRIHGKNEAWIEMEGLVEVGVPD